MTWRRASNIPPGGGGRHEALGTYNRLLWLGDTYLELIGVFDRIARGDVMGRRTGASGARGRRRPRDMGARERRHRRRRRRLRARGSDIGDPVAGERRRPDGAVVRWRLAAPPRLGPDLPPFLIEHDATAAEWTPAERAERARDPARLAVLELAVDDVRAVQSVPSERPGFASVRHWSAAARATRTSAVRSSACVRDEPLHAPRHTVSRPDPRGCTTAELDALGSAGGSSPEPSRSD